MTKTLEEILTKLEKDFSELKEYAVKLEAENCMLRKELDKKDEDIQDNCAITLAQALNSAYVEKNHQDFKHYINSFLFDFHDPDNIYISSFHKQKFSKIARYSFHDRPARLAILAVILIHYGIDIEIDINNFQPFTQNHFNEKFEKYKERIKFKPIKS